MPPQPLLAIGSPHQCEDEDGLPSQFVTDMTEEERANWAGDIAHPEGRQCQEKPRRGVQLGGWRLTAAHASRNLAQLLERAFAHRSRFRHR
jgi:hypothetical protein